MNFEVPAPSPVGAPGASAGRKPIGSPLSHWLVLCLGFAFLACQGALQAGALNTNAWAELKARGVLRWGNDAEGGAPYIFHSPDHPETLTGFEVDLANELARRLQLKGEFVQGNWDMLIPTLRQGNAIDLILAGLERTPENLAKVAMSRPYYFFAQQLVVRAGTPPATGLSALHL